jgi:hypothetical protein
MLRALLALACVSLFSAGARAAVTYSFDWTCSGCAKTGMGSNGKEGPFGSSAACEAARASLGASLATRGCGERCFNPQPCVSMGRPDALPSLAVSSKVAPAGAHGEPLYDPRADRVRRADEVKHGKEKGSLGGRDVVGRWRTPFSWYEARQVQGTIEIVLVATCRTPDCLHKDHPNRAVFHGKLEGSRLIGMVPIGTAVESEQDGRHCATPTGEFPAEGSLAEDGGTISWKPVRIPVGEGCAPAGISLGTWRRG